MKISKICAKVLEVIGYLVIPIALLITLRFTMMLPRVLFPWNSGSLFALGGFGMILLPWLLGLRLYIFYVKHSRNDYLSIRSIRLYWLLSFSYNALCLTGLLTFIWDYPLGFLEILWMLILSLHVLLSICGLYYSIRRANALGFSG